MISRTKARAAAMKLLYEWDMGGDGGDDTLGGILEVGPHEEEYGYINGTVEGVKRESAAIDERIERFSEGWKLDRLMRVDLAILRLATYELIFDKQLSSGIVINSAIELARDYSTDKAGSFINGVLGNIHREEAAREQSGD
ncbi:transcription antitermination factor NusB [Eubacteriales bacterium OttesenSCG-928-N13]|nr:transcription antitermination factor NusB [Eubacteriales bacterium OttesenSCG-928-N13]